MCHAGTLVQAMLYLKLAGNLFSDWPTLQAIALLPLGWVSELRL